VVADPPIDRWIRLSIVVLTLGVIVAAVTGFPR
jgi:hypothetical protein